MLFQIALSLTLGVAASSSSGCGSTSSWVPNKNNHFNRTGVEPGNRSYLVHFPAAYNNNITHAVVLSFHGNNGYDTHQELITQLSDAGLTIGGKHIIAVYPNGAYGPGRTAKDGPERSWQGAPYAKAGVDDIAFTQTVVKEVQENLCVDPKLIYASGKSNGGGFTNLLACTSSTASLFAAFAPVSAALYPGTLSFSGCAPNRTGGVPIINFHGLNDTTIKFGGEDGNGDPNYVTPNITVWRQAWATRNGCKGTPPAPSSVTHPHGNATAYEWDCSSAGVFKGYSINDLGHSWPSIPGYDKGNTPYDSTFNATAQDIIPFFNKHTLP